jgi:hypothetical protein
MNESRAMLVAAIGRAEDMFRRGRNYYETNNISSESGAGIIKK